MRTSYIDVQKNRGALGNCHKLVLLSITQLQLVCYLSYLTKTEMQCFTAVGKINACHCQLSPSLIFVNLLAELHPLRLHIQPENGMSILIHGKYFPKIFLAACILSIV